MSNSAIKHLRSRAPILTNIIKTIPPPKSYAQNSLFYDLVSCVVDQQIPHRSRGIYVKKLEQLIENEPITPESILNIDERAFAEQKIANTKHQTLMRLAHHWQTEQWQAIDWSKLSDVAIKEKLGAVKGVGNWTIEMILLFSLERPDVFPADDYHLKQMMTQLYGLNPKSKLKAQMIEVSEPWQPYRSLGVRYILDWKAHLKNRL
ncbi:MAG: hypothetical protein AAF960_24450 [Bacteroidota bacterium]